MLNVRPQSTSGAHQRILRRFLGARGALSPDLPSSRSESSSVLEQLESNNLEFQELKLSSVHAMLNFERLLKSIVNNRTVKVVRTHGFFLEKLSPTQQLHFLEAIAGLTSLEQLHTNYFLNFPLTSAMLKRLLGNALRLTHLCIHDSKLSIDNHLTLSLQNQHTLRIVNLSQISLAGQDSTLDSIMSLCTSAPNLQKLVIRMAQPQSNLAPSTIELLAQKRLKTLELRRVPLDDNLMILLLQFLGGNETALSKSLQELALESDEMLNESSCVAIGEMLQSNSSLAKLELWGNKVDPSGISYITNALKSNRTLKALYMSHDNIGQQGQAAFVDMLREHNYFLESIVLPYQSEMFLSTLDFFLKMNATQIRRLLLNDNANAEQIIDKILVHSSNLDYVFHLLLGNPNLISLA